MAKTGRKGVEQISGRIIAGNGMYGVNGTSQSSAQCKVSEDNSGALEVAKVHPYHPANRLNVRLHHFQSYEQSPATPLPQQTASRIIESQWTFSLIYKANHGLVVYNYQFQ